MKIDIIGGRGFIGSSLIDPILSSTKKEVFIETVDKLPNNFNTKATNICLDLLNKGSINSIFTRDPPSIIIDTIGTKAYDTNFDLLVNIPVVTASLCDSLVLNSFKGRVIYISSVKAVSPLFAGDFYRLSENLLLNTSKVAGFKVAIIRVPTVYGVRETFDDIVNLIIEQALLGEDVITMDKGAKLDLLHITDLVGAIVSLLKSENTIFENIYSLSGSVVTTEKLISLIKDAIGYGSFSFSEEVKSNYIKIDDSNTRKILGVKRTLFNKKIVSDLVKNRKDILVKKGYKETDVEV